MPNRLDPFVSHIYGIKDGVIVHMYLDERRMLKRLVNLRSDGSCLEYVVPRTKSPAAVAAEIFGFSNAVEIRDPDSEDGQQLLGCLEDELPMSRLLAR